MTIRLLAAASPACLERRCPGCTAVFRRSCSSSLHWLRLRPPASGLSPSALRRRRTSSSWDGELPCTPRAARSEDCFLDAARRARFGLLVAVVVTTAAGARSRGAGAGTAGRAPAHPVRLSSQMTGPAAPAVGGGLGNKARDDPLAYHLTGRARPPVGMALAVLLVAGVALVPAPALGAPSASLTRYPYLTDLVGGSVTVNWATTRTSAVTGSVTIGKVGVEPAWPAARSPPPGPASPSSRSPSTSGGRPSPTWSATPPTATASTWAAAPGPTCSGPTPRRLGAAP